MPKTVRNQFDKYLTYEKLTNIFKGKQGVNFCGYKINEYRLKLRDKGKRKLKQKEKKLRQMYTISQINYFTWKKTFKKIYKR